MDAKLGDRKSQILYAVVNDYIVSAEPVGSAQISKKKDVGLSSATVRTVMAELEERGFLKRAHSSSGRMPTDAAYRVYVDQLMKISPPSPKDREELKTKLTQTLKNLNDLPRDSGRVLSEVAHHATLTTYPKTEDWHLEQIQFCKLKGKLVLTILVSTSGLVENKILKLTKNLKASELAKMQNYLNSKLRGLTLAEARQTILREIEEEKSRYDSLIRDALLLSQDALAVSHQKMHIEGQSHLFEGPDFLNFQDMQKILKTLEEKTSLGQILDDCLKTPGIKILIGEEFKTPEVNGLALITSPYTDAEGNRGLLGVIGPTRVDYARVIPLVEYTSNLVTNVLKESKI